MTLHDPVNGPSHYTYGKYEVIDILEMLDLNFHLGNVLKYVFRYKYKNGIEDIKKAQFYLKRHIEHKHRRFISFIKFFIPCKIPVSELSIIEGNNLNRFQADILHALVSYTQDNNKNWLVSATKTIDKFLQVH